MGRVSNVLAEFERIDAALPRSGGGEVKVLHEAVEPAVSKEVTEGYDLDRLRMKLRQVDALILEIDGHLADIRTILKE